MKVLQMHAPSDEKKANLRGVIFDLDGTLVDTAPDLAKALNHCLEGDSLKPFAVKDMRNLVGHGAGALLRRGYQLREGQDLKGERFERLLKKFLSYYEAHIADNSHPFAGVENALQTLKAADIALGICTNKPHDMAMALLRHLGWLDLFQSIIGGNVLGLKKPDPGHIFAVAQELGIKPEDCVFVGDSEVDYNAGKNANMRTIIVRFGYRTMALEDMHGAAFLSGYDDLLQVLKTI